jgi:hypothetical protein
LTGLFPGISFVFAEDASAIRLAVEVVLFGQIATFPITFPEILVVKRNADFLCDILGDGFHHLVILMRTDEKGGGERVEGTAFGDGSRSEKPHAIAEAAADVFAEENFPQEAAEIVFVVIDYLQGDLPGELLDGFEPPGELGVRMDVGIVEKAGDPVSRFEEAFDRERPARSATEVKKNVHGRRIRESQKEN